MPEGSTVRGGVGPVPNIIFFIDIAGLLAC